MQATRVAPGWPAPSLTKVGNTAARRLVIEAF
jgi:hypothetical protein